MKLLKKCAARIFKSVTATRNALYDNAILHPYKCGIPVISIGNIQAGGSGKTPLAIFLARALKERGRNPVLLSRGYGAKVSAPLVVTRSSVVKECGDEPLLLMRETGLPVVVCPDRIVGAQYIIANKLGDLILLDDGFQHRRLHRDLDILLLNVGSEAAKRDILENRLLPYGLLREDRDAAVRRAQIIILSTRRPMGNAPDDPQILNLIPKSVSLYRSFFEARDIVALDDGRALEKAEVVAFCGIADPSAFYESLEQLSFRLHDRVSWPDHHSFSERDLTFLRNRFPAHPLVCTEKDSVRLSTFDKTGIYVLRGGARVSPGDAFLVQVMKSL